MIKRVNFTGRRRIARDRVQIEVYDGQPRRFDAMIDLADLSFPVNAAVRLEAMCAGSNVVTPFEFGTVGNLRPAADRDLRDVEGKHVFFALKVIDRTERIGRLLGIAENIRPQKAGTQTATGRQGILPIKEEDLNQQLWRLDFGMHDVCLLVNKNVPGLRDRARWDPIFYATVYPAIVREVLGRAIDAGADAEEDSTRWPVLWLRFGRNLHPERKPEPSKDDEDAREEWIDEVVGAFCEVHSLKDKYASEIQLRNGGDA
jgi:hypothetical protein